MDATLPPHDTTDEEFDRIVAAKNRKMARCIHDYVSVYPDEDSPFPTLEVLECRKCWKAKSGSWVIRKNGKNIPTKEHGMGYGTFEHRIFWEGDEQ